MFSPFTHAEDWRYVTTRYSDRTMLEVDYDNIHEDDGWLFFNVKYSAEIGSKPTYPDVEYKFEKFAVSCSRGVGKLLYSELLYTNGNRHIGTQEISVENAKEVSIPNGSEMSRITSRICKEQTGTRPHVHSTMLPNGLNSVGWEYVTTDVNHNSKVFISPSTISMHEGGIVSFLGKFDFTAAQQTRDGATFTTLANQVYIDCKNLTYSMTLYDYYNNNGQLVDTYSQDAKDAQVFPIETGSVISFAQAKTCSNGMGGIPTVRAPDQTINNESSSAQPRSKLAPGGVRSDDWLYVGDTVMGNYFVKKESLQNKGDKVVFVGGLTFKKTHTSPHGKPYIFGAELTYFNCATMQYSHEDTELFDSQGNFVDIIPVTLEENTPHQLHNQSNKKIQDYICQAVASNDGGENHQAQNGKEEQSIYTGTAWQISRTQLVTANHVIEGADSIVLVVAENDVRKADVVSRDPANDIAIIKIQGAPLATAPLKLASRQARLGSKIAVLGFPLPDVLGSKIQATSGEISGLGGIKNDPRFYQISAAVQSGNSGGPVLNENDEVIGVVISKLDALNILKEHGDLPQNVNFAVKQSYLLPLIDTAGIVLPNIPPRKASRIEDVISLSKDSVYLVVVSAPPHQ